MLSNPPENFAVFILTHGRPDQVYTYDTIRECGYTGPIFLILDNLDKTIDQYRAKYGDDQVVVFDKQAVAKTMDNGDNSGDLRAAVFARNAIFEASRQKGFKYFIQLDDDYYYFRFKFGAEKEFIGSTTKVKDLNRVFSIMLKFFIESGCTSLAMAQEGDFLGGENGRYGKSIRLFRKCMNSWICDVDRPFQFIGRMNDDVNTYVVNSARGKLFFTINQVALHQPPTQAISGGMTDIYKSLGTYMKTFYTVMMQPSSVKVGTLRGNRIHHHVNWKYTAPMILRESVRK